MKEKQRKAYMTKSMPMPIIADSAASIHQMPHVNLSNLRLTILWF